MTRPSPEKWKTHHSAGTVRGIEVAVLSRQNGEYAVQLLDTFEGMSQVGELFVGRDALRRATVLSELVFSALGAAEITWSSSS